MGSSHPSKAVVCDRIFMSIFKLYIFSSAVLPHGVLALSGFLLWFALEYKLVNLVVLSASLCQHPYEGSSQEFSMTTSRPIEWTPGVGHQFFRQKRQEHMTVANQTTKLKTLGETRVILTNI